MRQCLFFIFAMVGASPLCAAELHYLGAASSPGSVSSSFLSSGYVCPADGLMVVVWGWASQSGPQFKIAGADAEYIVGTVNAAQRIAIVSRAVTAGTYSVEFVGGTQGCRCVVYLIEGYVSTSAADSLAVIGSSADRTLELEYPSEGGFGIYGTLSYSPPVLFWTSATEQVRGLAWVYHMSVANKVASGTDFETVVFQGSAGMAAVGACWSVVDAPWTSGKRIEFCLQVAAFAGCWLCGLVSLAFFFNAKRQGNFW